VLLGLTGQDEAAQSLASLLTGQGVDTARLMTAAERVTITKTRVVSGQQQIVRLDREDRTPVPARLTADLVHAFRTEVQRADACVLSDYGKGLLSEPVCREMVAAAIEYKRPVVVDPKGASYLKYAGCTVVTPNLREAEMAAGLDGAGTADLDKAVSRLHETLRGSAVLVTRGSEGMTLFRKSELPFHVPALARQVFDVTGAGDTVAGTLTLALAAGATLEHAVVLANVAASVVVQKSGTATLTPQELLSAAEQDRRAGTQYSEANARSYASVPNRERVRG
jgi:D-beta-D-heptose 7-phosphate kinase/D-beta-D-heptose 1-phosphate adenosyltransferase